MSPVGGHVTRQVLTLILALVQALALTQVLAQVRWVRVLSCSRVSLNSSWIKDFFQVKNFAERLASASPPCS